MKNNLLKIIAKSTLSLALIAKSGYSMEAVEKSDDQLIHEFVRDLVVLNPHLEERSEEIERKQQISYGLHNNIGLSDLKIDNIPRNIGNLIKLRNIYLQDNLLTSLPTEIAHLMDLQILNLHNNQLVSLPSELGKLKELTSLYLDQNQLTTIPREISSCETIYDLNLCDNPLTFLPIELGLHSPQELCLRLQTSMILPPCDDNVLWHPDRQEYYKSVHDDYIQKTAEFKALCHQVKEQSFQKFLLLKADELEPTEFEIQHGLIQDVMKNISIILWELEKRIELNK
jgi:Leucine-rich repeat (LRR) protein